MMKVLEKYPDYQVTDDGQVWSEKSHRWLRPGKHRFGYAIVNLYRDNRPHLELVHRLVLEAFVGPCPPGLECRHLNGNPTDNRLENLAWGTHTENMADRTRHGTDNRGTRSRTAKLTQENVYAIRTLHRWAGYTKRELAQMFGVSFHTVTDVILRRRWAWCA